MSEMTVREALSLLSYGCKYRCVGARTGKKLFDNSNSDKVKEKYMDKRVIDRPFGVELNVRKESILNSVASCSPIIRIWVSGE